MTSILASFRHIENPTGVLNTTFWTDVDGFAVMVQPTRDAVCVVMHDFESGLAISGDSQTRNMKYSELPKNNSGQTAVKLLDVMDYPAKMISVELLGEPGWKSALAAVEASEALGRVVFSSLEHSEILQLWAACPRARCGFVWDADEADAVSEEEIRDLPKSLFLFVPIKSIDKRVDFWKQFADRLVVRDVSNRDQITAIGFSPFVFVVNGTL